MKVLQSGNREIYIQLIEHSVLHICCDLLREKTQYKIYFFYFLE